MAESVRDQALAAAAYLREEADFNRSWAEGCRGRERQRDAAYIARRIEIAEEREHWAAAIEKLSEAVDLAQPLIAEMRLGSLEKMVLEGDVSEVIREMYRDYTNAMNAFLGLTGESADA